MEAECQKREKLAGRTTDKQVKAEYATCVKVLERLQEDKDVRHCEWTGKDVETINQLNLFSAKNIVFLVNVSEKNWKQGANKWIVPIKEWVKEHSKGSPVIPFSAKFEEK